MKRSLVLFILCVFCGILSAQDTIVVHQGSSTQRLLLSQIDSISHTGNNVNLIHELQASRFPVSSVDSITIHKKASVELEKISITNEIDWSAINVNSRDFRLLSLQQDLEISSDQSHFVTQAFKRDSPQLMLLLNNRDEIIMMSKSALNDGDINVISPRSTAIALVTLHPIFAFVNNEEYEQLVQIITSSPYFDPFEQVIKTSLQDGRSLFVDNNEVSVAFSALMEDLTSETFNENYDNLEVVVRNSVKRAIELNINKLTNLGPIAMELKDRRLFYISKFNTPYYEGNVTSVYGSEPLQIEDGPSLCILEAIGNAFNHEHLLFDFNNRPDGEYKFQFKTFTNAAMWRLALHLFGDLFDVLSIPTSLLDYSEFQLYLTIRLAQETLACNDMGKLIEFAVTTTLDFVHEPAFVKWLLKQGITESAIKFVQHSAPIANWYQTARGSVDMIQRLRLWADAPYKIEFRLCSYDGTVSACTEAKLEKSSGDNQEGYQGDCLPNPLEVKVLAYGDDGSVTEDRNNYYRVKFKVVSGGGYLSAYEKDVRDGVAKTNWWLGHYQGEQKVRACIIDIVTGQEISEPVYFTANSIEASSVTFRLKWDFTLSKTDIDLHVECPKGHHIYYQNMSCPCGGKLDRDDRSGPGPEHIVFENAEPGDYIVYVHHYESDNKGNIGFVIDTRACERDYRTVSSVPYHTYSSKYRLRLPAPDNTNSRRARQVTIEPIEIDDKVYPELPQKN